MIICVLLIANYNIIILMKTKFNNVKDKNKIKLLHLKIFVRMFILNAPNVI